MLRTLLQTLLTLTGLLLARLAPAQTLTLRDYTLANGLPQTIVYGICQDAQGRLWAGTQGGVCSFDGHQFRTLTTVQGLPDNHVRALAPAPDGTLWLGHNYGGVSVVRPDGRVRRCRPRGLGVPAGVRCVLPLGGGTVWVATEGAGLFRLRCGPADTTVQRFGPGPGHGLPSAQVLHVAVAAGPAGRLWVATGAGLVLLDAAGAPVPGLPAELGQGPIGHCQVLSDTLLWCATARGLLRLSGRGTPLSPWRTRRYGAAEGLCAVPALRVLQDRAGNVWATTTAGLSERPAGAARFRCRASRSALDSEENNDLLEDREGNIWFVYDQGLAEHPADERFRQYTRADGLPDNEVQAVLPLPGGRCWVGTRAGLVELTTPADGVAPRIRRLPQPGDAGSRYVRALFRDHRGDCWVGTENGAARYAPGPDRWTYFNQGELAGRHVVSVAEDGRGRVWLATSDYGAAVLDPATGRFKFITTAQGLPSDVLWQVFGDRAGGIWLASDDQGLLRADLAHDTFARVPGQPLGLNLGSISEDEAGQLWLGTIGRGVLRYSPASGRFQSFGPEVGLQSSNPYFVKCDSAGRVWVGTNRGLDCFDPRRGQTSSYGVAEGFLSQETNQNAVHLGPAGQLWVGTINGLVQYDPARARPNRVPPITRISGVQLFLRDTAAASGLRLPATLNHLTFDYVGTSLTYPDKVRYQYRLLGFEDDWAGPLTATSATYTNLAPGRYTFEVRAANEDGVWSARPAQFALTIAPPWWRTWWAYGAYLLAFGLTLYGVRGLTRGRERDLAERQLEQQALAHLQELDRVKTNFFTNVSHELRTPLTLILGPAEELATDAPDPAVRRQGSLMLRNARKLLALINQLLDLSKLEAGALRLLPTAGDAGAAARQVVAAFASLAESRRILLRCAAPATPVPLVFDAAKLDEILTNLIANALRFTPPGGFVTVSVVEALPMPDAPTGSVVITVRDTGSGIAAADLPHLFDRFYQASNAADTTQRTGTGIGLALVRELVALHGGTVSAASPPGEGATFTVRLLRGLRPVAPTDEPASPDASATAALYTLAASTLPPVAEDAVAGLPEAAPPTEAAEPDVVLIIEDNDDVREFIRATLAPGGYRLLLAADGAAGVALARAEVPDLVVTDLMMPGLNGYEVCAALKTDPATSHVPVVLLTARSGAEAKLEGLETGADVFLAKPFNPRELRAQVRNLLALRQRLHARLRQHLELPTAPAAHPVGPLHPAAAEALAALPAGNGQVSSAAAEAPEAAPELARETSPAAPPAAGAATVEVPVDQPAANAAEPTAEPAAEPIAETTTGLPVDPQVAHAAAVAGLPSLDQEFLRRIDEAVLHHLGDEAFGVDELGSAIGMSRTQVHRKLKALTGQSPGEHIRGTRLHRARALLRAQVGTVAEVAYQVGFGSPAAFSTAFSRQFGYPPSVAFQQRPAAAGQD